MAGMKKPAAPYAPKGGGKSGAANGAPQKVGKTANPKAGQLKKK